MDAEMYNAAAKGEIEIFKQRVDSHERLSILVTPRKNTILHIHITAQTRESGDDESTQFVEQILDICPSLLLEANNRGETLLHIAARNGLAATAKALLERAKKSHHNSQELESGIGAVTEMVRMTSMSKDTALHAAVRNNHIRVVELLIREDPEFPYFGNEAGETPLYLAAERGYRDLVFDILGNCTSPAHGGPNGKTSLHAAAIFNDEVITRKILETKGSLATEADHKGWTPLHYAAHFGHVSVLKQLLNYDQSAAYIGDKDEKKTPLQVAASQGHIEAMNELLSCCPDCCELVDHRGQNVLHYAMESIKSDEVVKFFVENSSLCNLVNENGSNMMTFKIKNLSAPDIVLANGKFSGLKKTNKEDGGKSAIKRIMLVGMQWRRAIMQKVDRAENKTKEKRGKMRMGDISKKMSDTHLIVATLIATVTFTAGFTMPGGFNNKRGPTEGDAILIGTEAFKAFVITNTMAMVLSSSSVACHIFMGRRSKDDLVDDEILPMMFVYTVYAMLFMAVAFFTGTYAVLQHSSVLATAICVTGGLLLCPLVIACGMGFDEDE